MLGKAGLGTKFQVDRTQAENVAFSVIDKPKVYRDPYSLMCCACTSFKVGAWTMHTAFNLADCNFESSILPLLPNVHVVRCSHSMLNISMLLLGKSKATRHRSQAQFVLARWWFVHPRFAEFVRDSLHHADGLQDFMPKPEHWELMTRPVNPNGPKYMGV